MTTASSHLALSSDLEVLFTPQQWRRDYADEAEPKGPQVWRPAPYVVRDVALHCGDVTTWADYMRYEQWFETDPSCPEWIKKWSGPFYVAPTGLSGTFEEWLNETPGDDDDSDEPDPLRLLLRLTLTD